MALSWSLTGSFSSCLRKQTKDISLQSLYRSQSVTRKTEYWKANWPLHWTIILKAFLTSAIYSYTEIAYTFFHAQRKNIYYYKLKKLILKMLNINFNAKQTLLMSASILGSTSSIQRGDFLAFIYYTAPPWTFCFPSLSHLLCYKWMWCFHPSPLRGTSLMQQGLNASLDLAISPRRVNPHSHNSL